MQRLRLLPALLLLSACTVFAQMQSMPGMDKPASTPASQCMPWMDMPGCPSTGAPMQMDSAGMRLMQQMHPHTFIEEIQHHATSGTSAEPNSTPAPMLMSMHGEWMLMLHGGGFLSDIQQSSARGGDKLFSTNWLMPMAEREVGPGQLTLRAMFSLEPATVTSRRYPLLFQQGETAYGKAIADGQHPHDFFMELAALYDLHAGEHSVVSFYAAPIGDPALGPTAYPHRASAAENPVGTLGHHQEDSTHIASDVVTLGLTHRIVRVEVSGFHGREPNENRWNIDQGRIDFWMRIENAGRTNELLLGERALPAGFSETPLTHVQAYTFGYDRELAANLPHLSVALGGQITGYGVGKPLQAVYGDHPVGGLVFVRLRRE